ncbi:MAG: hypothetical protein A2048_06825 [Deltaproteobacteria bacterium GWA2_45_12]|nr:MAG: hypothetical protein A2048_06825 [Deltaproteobacteria bacterium GWA2_45_12]
MQSTKELLDGGNKMVLIVDDEDDVRLLLRKTLTKKGYQVQEAASVEKALEFVKQKVPHLIILDLGFKKASGLALLENIKDYVGEGKEPPPIVVLSGYSDPEVVNFASELGAESFIEKPFDVTQVVSQVQELLH